MTPADLRAARKTLGLTQHELAERLRMGKYGWQTISKWESDANERGVPGPAAVAIDYMLREAGQSLPSPETDRNAAMLDQARKAFAANFKGAKPRDIVEIMEGKCDHTPAMRQHLAEIWASSGDDGRGKFEAEITDWLQGIRDHTDNETEYDLLGCLIDSIQHGEYIEGPPGPDPTRPVPEMSKECPF